MLYLKQSWLGKVVWRFWAVLIEGVVGEETAWKTSRLMGMLCQWRGQSFLPWESGPFCWPKCSTILLAEICFLGKMWSFGCLYELNKHLKQALWIILNNIPFWHDLRIYTGFSMWVLKAPNYVLPSLFPGLLQWLSGKESACQCRRCGFDPWVGKIPWSRKWQSTQFSCLGNPMNRGAWQATVHGVSKSQTWLTFGEDLYFLVFYIKLYFSNFLLHRNVGIPGGKGINTKICAFLSEVIKINHRSFLFSIKFQEEKHLENIDCDWRSLLSIHDQKNQIILEQEYVVLRSMLGNNLSVI